MATTGERQSAAPTWPAAYVAGLQAGYWARIGEENERWRASIERYDVVEKPNFVRIAGKLERCWTWREREADRLETLRQGHAAGLHADRNAAHVGCVGCS
jgi:hypothetical protein